jgi:apolipoprotein N-acyltransferase
MAARVALVLLSAALQAAALPPIGWSGVAWVALVPLLVALRGLGVVGSALAGLLWGTVAVWGVGYWVPIALATYYEQPWWFGTAFALVASILFAGSYTAAFAACTTWVWPRTRASLRPVLVACLWVGAEFARARLMTGEPWILFGYALMPETPLIQVADFGGVYALSFQIVLVNAALAAFVLDAPRTWRTALAQLAPTLAIMAGVVCYGAYRLSTIWPATPATPVTIVQGNNDVGHLWREEFYGEGLKPYLAMSLDGARANRSELIVWPESSITFFLAHEPSFQAAIGRMLRESGADLVLGGPYHDDAEPEEVRYYNSAFYVDRDGTITSRYDKTHLLPFAEYFPLRTIEFLRRRFEHVRFFTHGEPGARLATRFGDVATVICFEGIFPELVRAQTRLGARLLINLSNDAWLGPGPGPAQHLAMVALRAVENRLWVIRATTTGISALIDPNGRVVDRTAGDVATFLNGTVVPMDVATGYKRWGDAFAYGCVVAALGALVLLRGPRDAGVARDERAREPPPVAAL